MFKEQLTNLFTQLIHCSYLFNISDVIRIGKIYHMHSRWLNLTTTSCYLILYLFLTKIRNIKSSRCKKLQTSCRVSHTKARTSCWFILNKIWVSFFLKDNKLKENIFAQPNPNLFCKRQRHSLRLHNSESIFFINSHQAASPSSCIKLL